MTEDKIYVEEFSVACNSIYKDEVNILHLSDLHFGIEKSDKNVYKLSAERQARIIKSLIETLKDDTKVPPNWKPDVVVISGDIGWTGSGDEYKKYKDVFLQPLLNEFSNLSAEKIITCPGNHDIIRENVKGYERPHSSPVLEVEAITRESIENVRKKHFQNYVDSFCGGDPQKMARALRFKEWPWLCFLVLNSAWDCRDKEDAGLLRVGAELLEEISGGIDSNNETVVALFHHPYTEVEDYDVYKQTNITRNWLHISERKPEREDDICFSNYVDDIADFILNGHIHVKTKPSHCRHGKAIQLISGTVYSKDSLQFHCRILKLTKGGEPLYIDMKNTLAGSRHLWNTSTPKNFRVLGVIARKQKQHIELENRQKQELLELKKACEEYKAGENMRNILIRFMRAVYPAIFESKLENQSITDEMVDEMINKIDEVINEINVLQLEESR